MVTNQRTISYRRKEFKRDIQKTSTWHKWGWGEMQIPSGGKRGLEQLLDEKLEVHKKVRLSLGEVTEIPLDMKAGLLCQSRQEK